MYCCFIVPVSYIDYFCAKPAGVAVPRQAAAPLCITKTLKMLTCYISVHACVSECLQPTPAAGFRFATFRCSLLPTLRPAAGGHLLRCVKRPTTGICAELGEMKGCLCGGQWPQQIGPRLLWSSLYGAAGCWGHQVSILKCSVVHKRMSACDWRLEVLRSMSPGLCSKVKHSGRVHQERAGTCKTTSGSTWSFFYFTSVSPIRQSL